MGVTDTGRRHPAVTAQAAATLHLLSPGRAILGIGPDERENNQPYGVDWHAPVSRFAEALATIRALWDSGGAPVNPDSAYFPLRDAVFDVPQYRGTWPEIWIGSHSPRLLALTGAYADCWFPVFLNLPKAYKRGLTEVRAAAENHGRDPRSVTGGLLLPVLTKSDVNAMVESVGARTLALFVPGEAWARHGVEHPLGAQFSGFQDLLPQLLDRATMLSYIDRVPASFVREYCLVGTPGEVLEQIAELRAHGVEHLVLANASAYHPSVTAGLASAVPFLRIMRGDRRL